MNLLELDGIAGPYGPIGRFLPNLPAGIIKIQPNPALKDNEVLYDPTGVSADLILALVAKGYRVLSSASNPVDRLLIEILADPPTIDSLNSVMADLAMLRYESTRFEKHLFELYRTTCGDCGREVAADAFVWDGESNSLMGKVYNCECGNGGEFPAVEEDLDLAKKWQRSDPLYRGGVIQKFKFLEGVSPDDIAEALSIYPPRALHGLDWIISRMGNLYKDSERANCLRALILFAADRCNILWVADEGEYRPKQIHKPARIVEGNLWKALNEGYRFLAAQKDRVEVTKWPALPAQNGVCIFPGSARRFLPQVQGVTLSDVVAVSPRPNQAYWTLSAIWSVWFLGATAEEDFIKVLQRKRFDWTWYNDALTALLKTIKQYVPGRAKLTLFASELEPSFITPIIFTLTKTGFSIHNLLPSSGYEVLKVESSLAPPNRRANGSAEGTDLESVLKALLADKTQPVPYLALLISVLGALVEMDSKILKESEPARFEKDLQNVLKGPSFVDVEKRANVETGMWLLREDTDNQHRLAGF